MMMKKKKINDIAVFLKENFPEIYRQPFSDNQLLLMKRAKNAFIIPETFAVQEKFPNRSGLTCLLLGIAMYFAVHGENRDIYFMCSDGRLRGVYATLVFRDLLQSKYYDLLQGVLSGGLSITLKNGCSLRFVFAGHSLVEIIGANRKNSFFIQDFNYFEYWKYPKSAIHRFYSKKIPGIIGI